MEFDKDPFGHAIHDYIAGVETPDIIVRSELCEDDIMEVPLLFRSYEEMPEIEKIALSRCKGRVLDVGAGAGCHTIYLNDKGFDVQAIDLSQGAVEYHKLKGIKSRLINFFDLKNEQYDTLLFLMNGIGVGGRIKNLKNTLQQAYDLTTHDGKVICDSSDLKYLYEDDEGGYWINLNAEYYGEYDFQMQYKETVSDWFEWLYVDFDTLKEYAELVGFKVEKLFDEDNHYLVELTK
jgi:SAM-dependent methyltransferase